MNAADILAYTYDGEIYCSDCFKDDESNPEIGVWFADNENDLIGDTCGSCRAWYAPDQGWTHDSPKDYRWITCPRCNSQRPYARDDRGTRVDSFRGKLSCINCRAIVHF